MTQTTLELLSVLIWELPTRKDLPPCTIRACRMEFVDPVELKTNLIRCRCVGVMKGGRVEILVNDQGNRITPSYVAFTPDERLVGDAAKNQYASNPTNTIFDIK